MLASELKKDIVDGYWMYHCHVTTGYVFVITTNIMLEYYHLFCCFPDNTSIMSMCNMVDIPS
jgi:hypothetical protein